MKKIVILGVIAILLLAGCAECREEFRTEWGKAVTENKGGN